MTISPALTLSSLSVWCGLFHLWIWTCPLLQIGISIKIRNRMENSEDPHEMACSSHLIRIYTAKTSVVVYSAERVKTNYRHVDFIIKRQPLCYHQPIVGEELMINSGSCSENYIIGNTYISSFSLQVDKLIIEDCLGQRAYIVGYEYRCLSGCSLSACGSFVLFGPYL